METSLIIALVLILALGLVCFRLQKKVNRLSQERALLAGRLEGVEQETKARDHLKDQIKNEFEVLAGRIFDEKGKKFTETNQRILEPLREQIGVFHKKVEDIHEKNIAAGASLLTKIQELQSLNVQLSDDAKQLTVAIKGDAQKRGAWGEMILERVLEASGLQSGREYELQPSFQNEGKQLRPDAVIHLPRGRDVVIDSKLSLVDYEAAVGAQTQAERERHLKAHASSIRKHIKELGGKYHGLKGLRSLDATLMFIPIESAFAEALRVDGSLQEEAFASGIVLAGPTTLFAHLKSIHIAWSTEYREKNIEEVVREVGAFLDKIFSFTEDLEKVGKSLEQAQNNYHEAHKKLVSGRSSVVDRAKKIKNLGSFHTKKSLPASDSDT